MNNKDLAKLLGRDTYEGKPCRFGHTLRKTNNGRCEKCSLIDTGLKLYCPRSVLPKTKPASEAMKAYQREYRKKNRSKLNVRTKQWHDEHKAQRAEYMKEYRLRNMDRPYYKLKGDNNED